MNIDTHLPMNYELLTLAMFLVNAVIFSICVCRLMKSADALWFVKVQYIIGAVVTVANGAAPIFFRQWPNGTIFAFTCWVCYMMWSDSYQWKHGVPHAAKKGSKDEPPRES